MVIKVKTGEVIWKGDVVAIIGEKGNLEDAIDILFDSINKLSIEE